MPHGFFDRRGTGLPLYQDPQYPQQYPAPFQRPAACGLFPGKYQYSRSKGYTLNLFGLMPGDNYYRAFDLDEYAV
jgi:hypothetical protein